MKLIHCILTLFLAGISTVWGGPGQEKAAKITIREFKFSGTIGNTINKYIARVKGKDAKALSVSLEQKYKDGKFPSDVKVTLDLKNVTAEEIAKQIVAEINKSAACQAELLWDYKLPGSSETSDVVISVTALK